MLGQSSPKIFIFLLIFSKSTSLSDNVDQELESDDQQMNCFSVKIPRPSFCRKTCTHQEQCRRGKKLCRCDGECGLSCISKCLNLKIFY
jgi:hypothetical protein